MTCWKSCNYIRALKKTRHTVNRSMVAVTPCPSWEQPLPADFYFGTQTRSTAKIISLLSLNDDCLELIFNKLDLKDQVRLSLSHERFKDVFEYMICPRKINTFDFNMIDGFTMWEVRQLLKSAGPFIRRLEITRCADCVLMSDGCQGKIYDFIQEFCTNLRRVEVFYFVPRAFKPSRLLAIIDTIHLTELELYQCQVSDYNLKPLKRLRNLKSLGLAHNQKVLGSSLCYFKKVEKLSLFCCTNFSELYLKKACKSLPLRYLDLRGIVAISNWSYFMEHCKDLETLKMTLIILEGIDSIARLPKLKKLEMQIFIFIRVLPPTFYEILAAHHSEDLEELKITGDGYVMFPNVAANIGRLKRLRVLWIGNHLNNSSKELLRTIQHLHDLVELNINKTVRTKGDHVLPLLNHCPKLRTLNLRSCTKIADDFIFNAIIVLQNRASVPAAAPLEVLVFGTSVRSSIMHDMRYKNAKHLLRISFHIERCEKGYVEEKIALLHPSK